MTKGEPWQQWWVGESEDLEGIYPGWVDKQFNGGKHVLCLQKVVCDELKYSVGLSGSDIGKMIK